MPSWVKLLLVALSLGILFWPGILHHWEMVKDPYFAPYDAVQYIPPFFKFEPNHPIPTTYIKEYYLNALSPLLYKWSLILGAQLGDVRHFQLGMMYCAYVVFLGVMGRLGWILGGAALSFAVVALTATAWIFFGLGFTGGAPRMYAYPLIALILISLVRDRPHLLATVTVLGGLLYPVAAIIGGLCLASWLLLNPLFKEGSVSRWRLSRRVITLALTGLITILSVLPLVFGSAPYGRRVVEADIAIYPETGSDGNYRPYDQLPYKLFGNEWMIYFVGPLYSHGEPIVTRTNIHKNLDPMTSVFTLAAMAIVVFIVIVQGTRSIFKQDNDASTIRLITFFAVCIVLHVIAWLASPYLYIPTRYFMFSLPFLVTWIFPWSIHVLLRQTPWSQRSYRRYVLFFGIICAYLLAFGGRANVQFTGAVVEKSAQPLFDAIAALPTNVVIAGWPVGTLRKVEYVTRRNVFFTGDVHQVLHTGFIEIMRRRMDAIFEAYFSMDVAPLRRLNKEFGVTHLIVDTRDFTDPKHTPEYFSPWRSRIKPRLAEIRGKEFVTDPSVHEKAAIFDRHGFILLDLAKLP